MQELFSPFGPISRVYIAYDRDTGENRGFAFVNFVYRYLTYGLENTGLLSATVANLAGVVLQGNMVLCIPDCYKMLHSMLAIHCMPVSRSMHPAVVCMNNGHVLFPREDAAKAIDKLDGYGYDNLILRVEWAQPRAER